MSRYTGKFQKNIVQKRKFHYIDSSPILRNMVGTKYFDMDDELVALLTSTHRLLGILDGMIKYMPNCEAIRFLSALRES